MNDITSSHDAPRTSPFTGMPVETFVAPMRTDAPHPHGWQPQPSVEIPLGTFTVITPDRAEHETIKIHQPKEGSSLYGKTIVSHIAGPSNELDFQGFAFINDLGRVVVWSRFRGIDPRWVEAAYTVLRGDDETRGSAQQAYAMQSGRCARCGRKLTVPANLHRGVGPECASKEI